MKNNDLKKRVLAGLAAGVVLASASAEAAMSADEVNSSLAYGWGQRSYANCGGSYGGSYANCGGSSYGGSYGGSYANCGGSSYGGPVGSGSYANCGGSGTPVSGPISGGSYANCGGAVPQPQQGFSAQPGQTYYQPSYIQGSSQRTDQILRSDQIQGQDQPQTQWESTRSQDVRVWSNQNPNQGWTSASSLNQPASNLSQPGMMQSQPGMMQSQPGTMQSQPSFSQYDQSNLQNLPSSSTIPSTRR